MRACIPSCLPVLNGISAQLSHVAKLISDLDLSTLAELVDNPMDVALMYLTEILKDVSKEAMNRLITLSIGNCFLPDLLTYESDLHLINVELQAWYTSLQICCQNLLTFQRYASPKNKLSDKKLTSTFDEIDVVIEELNLQIHAQQEILQAIAFSVRTQQAKRSLQEAASTRR